MSSSGSLTTPVIVIRASPGFMGYVPCVPVLFSAPNPRSFRRSLPILSSSTTPPYTIGVISRPSCRLAPHPAGGRLPGSWWTGRCRCACGGGAGVGLTKQLSRLRPLGTAPLCLYCNVPPRDPASPRPAPSHPTPCTTIPTPSLSTPPYLPTPPHTSGGSRLPARGAPTVTSHRARPQMALFLAGRPAAKQRAVRRAQRRASSAGGFPCRAPHHPTSLSRVAHPILYHFLPRSVPPFPCPSCLGSLPPFACLPCRLPFTPHECLPLPLPLPLPPL